jgi:hypothetical protein
MGMKLNPTVRINKTEKIQKQLDDLDLKLARPTQAILAAQMAGEEPDPADVERFDELMAEKEALRGSLA